MPLEQIMFHPKPRVIALVLLLFLCLGVVYQLQTTLTYAAPSADRSIFADALATGWEDWSWDSTTNGANAAPVHSGTRSYAITYSTEWAGFYLRAMSAVSTAGYTHLRFFIHGGAAGGQQISLNINQDEAHTYAVTAPANTWQPVDVPLSALNSPATINDIIWQDATGGAQATYYLDDITLISSDTGTGGFPDKTVDRTLNFPGALSGVAIAPNGRLYVAAWRENRIYSWPNAQSAADPASSADLIFGDVANSRPLDPDGDCGPAATSATLLCGPESVAVDANNNLYVGDTYNHRVLIFLNPDTDASPTTADRVLGQEGSFTSHTPHKATTGGVSKGFEFARGVALAADGDLWAIDQFGYRALKFTDPINSDDAPDLVVGQANLATITKGSLNYPLGVAVDQAGNVYVADVEANRVVRFNTPAANQAAADRTYTDYAGANPFEGPTDVTIDANGNLYAAYNAMRRVGVFANPGTDTSGDYLFENVNYPHGMAFDANRNLYVALCNGTYPCNNAGKLLVFNAPTAAPTATPTATTAPVGPTATPTATSVGPTATPTATTVPSDITLSVNAQANRHPISDLIYGMHAVADESFAQEIGLPIRRWGGNNTTRYNWQIGATNHASDWYFHNNNTYDPVTMAAQNADQWVQRNQRTGTRSLITIPMIGYVAKDGNQATCAFPVSKYPGQDDVDDEDGFPNCGNGLKNGVPIQADPSDTSIPANASFIQQWITHLQQNAATNGPVEFYGLDNEPDIWFDTHRDVFPTGWKYDEFRDRTYTYAAAIKATDPNAKLLGPVVNGWTYYWYGAWDGQREDWTTPDDRNAHGGTPFVAWYLQQMKAYEEQNGVRLLDYLDLHYYPQNRDNEAAISLAPAGDAATQARRLRSTRSLWDPTYGDESWIADAGPEEGIIQLLPRMKAWVTENYPGTKLAISEYNWGGLESLNGALAQADVLGIFGREGLDLATMFDPAQGDPLQTTFPSSPGAFAFRLYRNYDGQGGRFGDTSVQASSSDQGKLSIYAAQRGADNALTLMIINKSGTALSAAATLAGFTPGATAHVFRYAQSDLTQIVRLADQPLSASGFTATFPANSITLLLLPAQGPSQPLDQKVYLPLVRR